MATAVRLVDPDVQPDPQLTEQLLESLGQLIRTARVLSHRQSEEMGFSGTPFGILKLLADHDHRPGDLAIELQIAPSVVSRALVPLEREGLLERRPDPTDARAYRVALTGAGRAKLAHRRQLIKNRLGRVLTDWPSEDVATLTRLMRRLDHDIQAHADDRGRRPDPESVAVDASG